MVPFKVYVEQVGGSAEPGHVNVFAKTISDPVMQKGSRHRRSIILDVPFNRKHARTVPEYKQADKSIIRQIEVLKNSGFVKQPLSLADIRNITKKFNINSIPQDKTTKLKNLGLGITWDDQQKRFYLHKL